MEFLRDFKDDSYLSEYSNTIADSLGLDTEEEIALRDFKYIHRLAQISMRLTSLMKIELDDVLAYGEVDAGNVSGVNLAEEIISNTKRFQELFAQACDELLETDEALITRRVIDLNDPMDVMERQRQDNESRRRLLESNDPSMAGLDQSQVRTESSDVPKTLTRRFQIAFIPPSGEKAQSLRHIRAEHVGKLVSLTGIVTRVTEVKPRVVVAGYACDTCGAEVYQEVKGRQFMPMVSCPNPTHRENRLPSRLHLNVRSTRFSKFQEVKIQESSDQVPVGAIPRSLTLHLEGEVTRKCTAGDIVKISGVFLPVPYTGYMAMRAGLLSDTYLEAYEVEQVRKDYQSETVSHEVERQLDQVLNEGNVYHKLSQSIAPEIFGFDDLKKALLLLLVGAPERKLADGMRLRGDLHICLMGDPGVAKSQLLKYIARATPRGVYTTGKGSSGVGLTAAVVRDALTNELMLEGGALILADRGICCIDEFDKMNEIDRTAIHEVMEQQTVSIAKAGITTSLNARAAVLAAANPAFGRYNRRKTPAQNINLPAALLSRFDLLFLLLDEADSDRDFRLAQHVTYVHRTGKNPPLDFEPLDMKVLRAYIAKARAGPDPVVPDDGMLGEYIVGKYLVMREEEKDAGKDASGYTTARTLLSILRLAQALARLRLESVVVHEDVDEAIRLMAASKASINRDDEDVNDTMAFRDPISSIYALIRSIAAEKIDESESEEDTNEIQKKRVRLNTQTIAVSRIEQRILASNFTREQMEECLNEYDQLNVWKYDRFAQKVRFIA